MQFQYTTYAVPLIIAAIISAWISNYSWRRRSIDNASFLSFIGLAITQWLVFYILQISGSNLPTKLFFGEAKYFGVALTPLFWFFFSMSYAGQGKYLTMRNMALMAIVPMLTGILAVTSNWHGLFWSAPQLMRDGNFTYFDATYGPWYWVHVVYSYLLILAGTVLVFRNIRHRQGLHRNQASAIIVAVLAPWLGNIVYFSNFNPIPYLDLTPFAFTISVTAITWAILGFRLVDLAPVARDFIVDEMKDGMIVLDAQGRIADINLSATRLVGVSAKEAVGKQASEVLAHWPGLVERYSQVMDTLDEIPVGEGYSPRWFELQISSLHDWRKRFIGRVIVMRDITARKEIENALSIALDEAREASHLKSQLLARVSHELRTPLGGILGYAELLHMNSFGDLGEKQQEAASQIIESAKYLDGIVNGLLDQAQLDAETLILSKELFPLESFLQKINNEMAGLASAKGLAFNTIIGPDVPKTLYGDQNRIGQILIHLLSNAIKFTNQGKVDLFIELLGISHWVIKVSDTGPGIPEEAQSYIFEPFRQVDNAITRDNRGTGLGLAISRQLVGLMEGEIQLESKLGQGSTFTVTLPFT